MANEQYIAGATAEGEMANDTLLNRFKKKEEAGKLVAWVKAEYEKAKQARKQEELDWYLQLAFYNGNQYHNWAKKGNATVLAEEPNPQNNPRLVINRIEPVIRTEIAKTSSGHPSATVIPASNDDDDLMAASAAEQVWQSLYNKNNFQTDIIQKSEFWRATCGNAFIKTYWDGSKKEITPTPVVDPFTGMKSIEQKVGAVGDVTYEVVSPFHLFVPDLAEENIENQPYLFNVYTKSEQWVKNNYKDVLPEDYVPTKVSASEIVDAAMFDVKGVDIAKPDAVLVIEMWAKPNGCPYLPKGGLITIVDNEIVQFAENGIPYSHKMYPFAHTFSIPTGKFYRRSVIKSLIPLQQELNRTRSQIVQAKNLMSKPQMFYAEGSTDPKKITARAGIYIPIRPGFQFPSPVPIQPLPNYVLQEVDRLQSDFEDISGQHQVSRGESGGVTAATAINYLQERDDAYLSTVFSSIEAAVEKTAKQSLSLFIQYVQQPRLVKTIGTDGAFDAAILSGADIASGNDIRVESGSALPTSKSARQALITEWMKMGFIQPQDGLRILDMGMLKQYYNLIKIDENHAQRENLTMKRLTPEEIDAFYQDWQAGAAAGDPDKVVPGQVDANGQPIPLAAPSVVQVHDYDNHAVHIEIHNRFRKSQSFETLTDEVRAEFAKHISMHEQALQQKMMQEMMMGMPAGGPQALPSEAAGAPAGTPDQSGMTSQQLQ
jgi:predicted DNA-binding transcriptional regulator AlpA